MGSNDIKGVVLTTPFILLPGVEAVVVNILYFRIWNFKRRERLHRTSSVCYKWGVTNQVLN
jgi:hypothetical protein